MKPTFVSHKDLPPFVPVGAKVLILGSLPSVASREAGFSILRSGYFYLDPYHEEHPRVFATNIRYRMMSLAWMETYGVS